MAKVKPNFAAKWARVTPQRTEDYAEGVQNPRTDWASAAKKAEGSWASGVQQAITDKRFGKGVDAAGTEKWQQKSVEVGAPRFGPGVQAAVEDYQKGFEPFAEVINNTVLPPKFPKGDPRNLDRVKVIAQALRNAKLKGV